MTAPAAVTKYLLKYGSDNWSLQISPMKRFNNIIVIPAVEEYNNIRQLLISLSENDEKHFGDSLIIFVINNTESAEENVKNDNQKSLELLEQIISKQNGDELTERVITSGLNIGLVNASSAGSRLPEKDGGVGLARKIGMDLALTVFDYSTNAKKILICLDADCTVEKNYLTQIVDVLNERNLSASFVQYEHLLPEEEKEKQAIICYEIFLRCYLLGLKFANSPFAFPTIGSTMICDYESYIKIGGMNKKKAAEDFYFMEKLAKITRVEKIESTKVYPASRGSWRVPFGTGQRVNRFLAGSHDEYFLYDPKSFDVLKKWLSVFSSEENLSAEKYLSAAESIHPALKEFLTNNSFEENWNKILASSGSKKQIQKQKLIWFDGFRTLKLIHFLRDNGFPLINMFDALDELLRINNCELRIERKKIIPPIEEQIEYLNALRKIA